jgi:hypothetical protein
MALLCKPGIAAPETILTLETNITTVRVPHFMSF